MRIELATLLISLLTMPLRAQFFETADQLNVTMTPSIVFDPSSVMFHYSYVVSNSSSSKESLSDLYLLIGSTISSTALDPDNVTTWRHTSSISSDPPGPSVSWYPSDPGKNSVDSLFTPPSEALRPGQSLSGLGINSTYLPGLATFYAQGWVVPANQSELLDYVNQKLQAHYDSPDDVPIAQLKQVYPAARDIKDNSFKGITVAPMQSPDSTTSAGLISRLADLKHQARSLGWIYGPGADGIVQSLDAKLTAAQDSISNNDNQTAINQLNAFINELEAQHGKHVNDNAHSLLKANAQFIISKLSQG